MSITTKHLAEVCADRLGISFGTSEQVRRRLVESGHLPVGAGGTQPACTLVDAATFILGVAAGVELRAVAQATDALSRLTALHGAKGTAGDALADLLALLATAGTAAAIDGEVVVDGRVPFVCFRTGSDGKPREAWFGSHDLQPQTWRTRCMRRLAVTPCASLAAIAQEMAVA